MKRRLIALCLALVVLGSLCTGVLGADAVRVAVVSAVALECLVWWWGASRMGAQLVPDFVDDLTPESERLKLFAPRETITMQRDRGAGRPTKRDRRQLEELMDAMDFE